ncbi:DUF3558 family protein [Streptomyces sp. NPDC127178]|uniref:DUF3558 family protein n=1 Tax=unclassified Streptomyces TaxID=2593676 RepID=UPI00362A08F2
MTHSTSGLCTRSRRAKAATAAACLAVLAALAGCGTDEEPARPSSDRAQATRSPAPSADRSSPAPSPSPSSAPDTLTELAERPCLALDDDDTGPGKLYVVFEGTEKQYKDTPKSCQWGAQGGLVDFTPHPEADLTEDKRYRDLTPRTIAGRRALLGTPSRHSEGSCIAFVSAGNGQSFQLTVVPFGEGAPGPDAPTLATNFAKAILAHLK